MFWSSIAVFAQQEAHFSQYMFSNLYFNPAYAGITNQPEVSLIARTQWVGYQVTGNSGDAFNGGQPNSQLLNASLPFQKIHGGLGLTVMNDKYGPVNNLKAGLSYSYIMKIGNAKLGIGLRGGIYNTKLDGSQYKAGQANDALIPDGVVSQTKPDIDGGIWYKAEKFYAGLGVNNINNPKFDYNLSGRGTLSKHAYLTLGYSFRLNYAVEFIPTALIKTDFHFAASTFDINGTFKFHEKYWLGAMYRLQDAVGLQLGMSLLKDNSLKVGYALDLTVIGNTAKSLTSHEFMLAYVLPPKVNLLKPIIRTPRYRFN